MPLLFALLGLFAQAPPSARDPAPYEVYAVRFATIAAFPVSSLVAGADEARTLDIAMMFWALRGADGRVVLVDAGFHRQKFIERWKPVDYVRPDEALERALGAQPSQVTDVLLSHIHWDHADGADLFPNARVWVQREEYDHHVGENGAVKARAIDADVARMLASTRAAGRLRLIDGDDQEVLPGIRVYTGGRHTFASQYAGVATRAGTVVIASDNAYLYENLDNRLAIAQTLDAESNIAAQARMFTIASAPRLVIPGHDPAVFRRFPSAGPSAVRVD
jgi:glyoxylase-like metal-dependent hydrolase (beta-lactamase superfamily II)